MKPDLELTHVTSGVTDAISATDNKHITDSIDKSEKVDNINHVKIVQINDEIKPSPVQRSISDMNGNTRPLSVVVKRMKGK